MTGNEAENNPTAIEMAETIDNLLYLNREYGMDVQDGFVAALNRVERMPCATMADAAAFIALGRTLTEHARVKCAADPALLDALIRAAEWYIGLGLDFLGREANSRQPRHIGPSNFTKH